MPVQEAVAKSCDVEGCNGKLRSKAHCAMHWTRLKRHGDVNVRLPNSHGGSLSPHWREDGEITYTSAHFRVRRLWGAASQYLCVSCSGSARDWAYDGTDPSQRYGPTHHGNYCYYSVFPEFYMPMCTRCHHRRDKALAKAELKEYREWKMRTGLTLSDIA